MKNINCINKNKCYPPALICGVVFSFYVKNLTYGFDSCIICGMKRLLLVFLAIATLAMTSCGVKSDLKRIGDFPRNYPVY